MLKASENPDCKNGFENIEIDCLTLLCPQLQITDEAFCALTQRETMKTFLATKQLGKITFQTENYIKTESVRAKEKRKKRWCVMKAVLHVELCWAQQPLLV